MQMVRGKPKGIMGGCFKKTASRSPGLFFISTLLRSICYLPAAIFVLMYSIFLVPWLYKVIHTNLFVSVFIIFILTFTLLKFLTFIRKQAIAKVFKLFELIFKINLS